MIENKDINQQNFSMIITNNFSKAKTSKFEILYIVDPKLGKPNIARDQINNFFGTNIIESKELGEKTFVKKMKKKTSGFYFLLHTNSTASQILEFNKTIKRMKEVIRFIVINLDHEKYFRYKKNDSETMNELSKDLKSKIIKITSDKLIKKTSSEETKKTIKA